MKKMVKTTVMVLMLFMAGTLALTAQQNSGQMRMDTTRMHRMMMNHGEMPFMMNNPDSMPMRGMRPGMMHHGMRGMAPGMMQPGMRGMGRGGMRDGMQGGMCQCPMMQGMMPKGMSMQHSGMGMSSGMQGMMHQRMIMENIPDLTDKQKKDIAVMRIDQQTEMKKMREDMQSKMKAMRETQRTNIEKLLTPEQKKWLDENAPEPKLEQTPKIPASKAPVLSK